MHLRRLGINSGLLRGAAVAGRGSGIQRLIHDPADGAGTTAALGAATQTAINLTGRARRLRLDGGANIVIAQDVARTDDHRPMVPDGDNRYLQGSRDAKKKRDFYTLSNLQKIRGSGPSGLRPRRRSAPQRCRRPRPRPGTCRRPRPSRGSPSRCRRGGSPAGRGRRAAARRS